MVVVVVAVMSGKQSNSENTLHNSVKICRQ